VIRCVFILALAALAAAGLAGRGAPAQAATRQFVTAVPGYREDNFQAIAAAGTRVVYWRPEAGRVRVYSRRPGGDRATLLDQKYPAGGANVETLTGSGLAASATRVAVTVTRMDRTQDEALAGVDLWTGRPDRKLVRVMSGPSARSSQCFSFAFSVAVAGDAVVDAQTSCSTRQHRIVVRDYAEGGAPRTLRIVPVAGQVAAAGRFVAWTQAASQQAGTTPPWTIVVYDRSRGAEAYRLPAAAGRNVSRIQLAADGTLLVTGYRDPAPGLPGADFLSYASVAEPWPHDTVPGSAPMLWASFAGGRALFATRDAASGATALVLRRLDGATSTIAVLPRGALGIFASFDGQRAAYEDQQCSGAALYLQSADQPGPPAGSTDPACPVTVAGGTARAQRGLVAVRVACRSGCAGTAELRRGVTPIAPSQTVAFGPGSHTVTFRLLADWQRRLRQAPIAAQARLVNRDRVGVLGGGSAALTVRG
jgi:hypothetical protein